MTKGGVTMGEATILYRDWKIEPGRTGGDGAWVATHRDYDGPGDDRWLPGCASAEEAKRRVDERIMDTEEDENVSEAKEASERQMVAIEEAAAKREVARRRWVADVLDELGLDGPLEKVGDEALRRLREMIRVPRRA